MQLFISLLLVSFRLKSGELEQAKSTMKIPKIAACLDVLDADLFVIINLRSANYRSEVLELP